MRFKAKVCGEEIEGDVVNPGEWWGKAWVVACWTGTSCIWLAVEAEHESAVFDMVADSERWGHTINVEGEEEDEDYHRAGNDGHLVDLTGVQLHGRHADRMGKDIPFEMEGGCTDLIYLVADGQAPMTPIEYANRERR